MGNRVIDILKSEIESTLLRHLSAEGIKLRVMLERIAGERLSEEWLRWEVVVILRIIGTPWDCELLIDGIYRALAAYQPSATELIALLMSLHVDTSKPRMMVKYVIAPYLSRLNENNLCDPLQLDILNVD